MQRFIVRGALAGVAGTIASVLTLLLLGETSIREAIALEDARNAAAGIEPEAMFSRPQQVLGGSIGLILFGLFIGTVFGIVYAANRHRLGGGSNWQRARRLGVIAFVAVYLVPFLKYPPNPPAVGDPETISQRTTAYVSLLVISVLAVVIAAALRDVLRKRDVPAYYAQPAGFVLWLAIVGVAMTLLPANPDQVEISVNLAWAFRMSSAAGQAAFWFVGATVFGWLMVRDEVRAERRAQVPVTGGHEPGTVATP